MEHRGSLLLFLLLLMGDIAVRYNFQDYIRTLTHRLLGKIRERDVNIEPKADLCTVKKGNDFPVPSRRMSLTNLAGNN
jgi:hypothetical protein